MYRSWRKREGKVKCEQSMYESRRFKDISERSYSKPMCQLQFQLTPFSSGTVEGMAVVLGAIPTVYHFTV